MNEVRRFLRYVIPGLGFFIEIFLYLFISAHEQVICIVKDNISQTAIIGSVLTLFVGSGGVGYLFSIIHHVLFHANWCIYPTAVDRRNLINQVRENRLIELQLNFNQGFDLRLNHHEAWSIFTAIWHERIKTSSLIRSINPHNETLSDIMHGSGTSLIGSCVAFLFFVFLLYSYHLKLWNSYYSILAIVIAFAMIVLHGINYRNSCEHFRRVTDTAFCDALINRSLDEKPVISIIIRGQDLH